MSKATNVPIRTCFVSYGAVDRSVETLIKYLEKNSTIRFIKHNFDLNDSETKRFVRESIQNCDLFIALVTKRYFDSDSFAEYKYAFEIQKPILSLFSSSAGDNSKYNNVYITMKRQLFYKLNKLAMSKNLWSEKTKTNILNLINEQMRQNESDIPIKKFSLNAPDNILIRDLLFQSKHEAPVGIIGRGTILDVNRILFSVSVDQKHYLYVFNQQFNVICDATKLGIEEISLLTTNKNSDILIYDNKNNKIDLFNSDFKWMMVYAFLDDYEFSDMCVDEDTNDVYLASCITKSDIYKVNHRTKQSDFIEATDHKNFKPRFIRAINGQIIVVNACSIRFQPDNREIIETTFGESIIYIFDKQPFQIKHLIDFKNYALCQPWGLIVDKDSNIYTTVCQLNEQKFFSKERLFCKLNKGGDLLDSIPLCNYTLPNDIIKINDRVIFLYLEEINVYE